MFIAFLVNFFYSPNRVQGAFKLFNADHTVIVTHRGQKRKSRLAIAGQSISLSLSLSPAYRRPHPLVPPYHTQIRKSPSRSLFFFLSSLSLFLPNPRDTRVSRYIHTHTYSREYLNGPSAPGHCNPDSSLSQALAIHVRTILLPPAAACSSLSSGELFRTVPRDATTTVIYTFISQLLGIAAAYMYMCVCALSRRYRALGLSRVFFFFFCCWIWRGGFFWDLCMRRDLYCEGVRESS